jgi:hypothetical protein
MIGSTTQFNFDFYPNNGQRASAASGMPTTSWSQQNYQSPSSSNPSNIKFDFQFALPPIQSLSATSNTQQSPTTNTGSTNSPTGSTSSSNGSSSQSFTKSFGGFLAAARAAGMSYQRTDPSNSNGMDCVTSLWGFLKKYLTPKDLRKLEPHKPQAYVWKEVKDMEQRIKGFSGAVEAADLGKSVKIDKVYVDSLVQEGDAAVKEALIGSIYTYSGKDGGHVSVISDAWIEQGPNGKIIKYKIIGAHKPGLAIEGNGLGTHKTTFDLMQDTRPGENLTLTQLNSDVVSSAEAANRNNSGQSAGKIVFNKVKGLAVA